MDSAALEAIKSAITSFDISKLNNGQAALGLASAILMALPTAGASSGVVLRNKNLTPSPPQSQDIEKVLYDALAKKRDECLAQALSGPSGLIGMVFKPKTEVKCIDEWSDAMNKVSKSVEKAKNTVIDVKERELATQQRSNKLVNKQSNANRQRLRKYIAGRVRGILTPLMGLRS